MASWFPLALLSIVLNVLLFKGQIAAGQSISVESYCEKELLNIKTIGEFLNEFLPQLKAKIHSGGDGFTSGGDRRLRRCAQDIEAIDELARVMRPESGLQDVCHPSQIDKMIKYHKRFITNYLDVEQLNRPAITYKLFQSYATHVSYVCKKNMLSNLKLEISTRKSSDDLMESITPWLKNKENVDPNGINQKESSLLPIDSIAPPLKDFVGNLLLPKLKGSEEESIDLSLESEAAFFELQSTCLFRLRPIYVTTIMPIIELANLGYSFQGPQLTEALAELRGQDNILAKRWYTIAQICEIFRQIDIGVIMYRHRVVRPFQENKLLLNNQMTMWRVHEKNVIQLEDQLELTRVAHDNNSDDYGGSNNQKKDLVGKKRPNAFMNSLMSNGPWGKRANKAKGNNKSLSSNYSIRWQIMEHFHNSMEQTKSTGATGTDQNRDLLAKLVELLMSHNTSSHSSN